MDHILRRAPVKGCLWLVAGLLMTACGAEKEARLPPLKELSAPDLTDLESAVAQELTQAHGDWQNALADEEKPLEEIGQAAGNYGRLLHAYGQLERAQAAYENAATLAPGTHAWFYLDGTLRQEKGEAQASIGRLEKAAYLAPDDTPTRLRLARAFLMESQPEPAKEQLQKVLELDPSSAMAFYLAGQLEFGNGNAEAALVAFDQALRLQPQANSVHAAMAAAFDILGDGQRAEAHRQRAGNIPIQAADPLRFQVAALAVSSADHLRRAYQARLAGDLEKALEFHRLAVEAAPRDARAHSALGAILAETGQLDPAIEEMRKAQRLGARDPQIIANLAEVHRLRGEYSEAAAAHRRVLQLKPHDSKAMIGLARSLASSGESQEAIEAYQEVLQDEPQNARVADELDTLIRDTSKKTQQPNTGHDSTDHSTGRR